MVHEKKRIVIVANEFQQAEEIIELTNTFLSDVSFIVCGSMDEFKRDKKEIAKVIHDNDGIIHLIDKHFLPHYIEKADLIVQVGPDTIGYNSLDTPVFKTEEVDAQFLDQVWDFTTFKISKFCEEIDYNKVLIDKKGEDYPKLTVETIITAARIKAFLETGSEDPKSLDQNQILNWLGEHEQVCSACIMARNQA